MKPRLISSNPFGSSTLRRMAQELSKSLGYTVYRSKTPRVNRLNLLYGDCKDKIFQYQWFKENQVPSFPFTTSQQEVLGWLQEGKTCLARTLTRASEGKGIVILEPGAEVVNAPVYTQYLPKKREYRIHIYKESVVAVLEKRKKSGGVSDTKIRNTANGYVFCRQNVVEPEGIRELALKARKVTNSDFCGVDIGYNEKKNYLFVIECNSAPGIEGSNITDYVNEIVKHV